MFVQQPATLYIHAHKYSVVYSLLILKYIIWATDAIWDVLLRNWYDMRYYLNVFSKADKSA